MGEPGGRPQKGAGGPDDKGNKNDKGNKDGRPGGNRWVWPVKDHQSDYDYGEYNTKYESDYHTGTDFFTPGGANVRSVSGGTVVLARPASAGSPYGNYVIIDHGNGIFSLYAHLRGFHVSVGDRVSAGDHIGNVGSTGTSTGDHLHLEIRQGGGGMVYGSDIDPIAWLRDQQVKMRAGGKDGGGNGKGDAGHGGGPGGGQGGGGQGGGGQGGGGQGGGGQGGVPNYGFQEEFLDAHPEVAALVKEGIREGWADAKFQYELQDTKWWKRHTQAQRQWALLIATKPADAKEAIKDAADELKMMAGQAGVGLTSRELKDLAEKAARNQWTPEEMKLIIGRHFEMGRSGDPVKGIAGATLDLVDQFEDDYGVRIDRKTKERWVTKTLQGRMDPSTMEDVLREQAKTLYPNVAQQLDTQSLREILAPYLSIASEELGIPVDQMRSNDGRWTKALGSKEGPMDADGWLSTIRTDPKYGWEFAPAGRAAGAELAAGLLQAMGGRL
jgi:hypothetical protein